MMSRIVHKLAAPTGHWIGDGFPVRSRLSPGLSASISPFLLLDHAGPADFEPTNKRRGVGEHPHRGFETVTLVYDGELEHRDSSGHGGTVGAGDVQWMTAGSGVLHEEYHSERFAREGGTLEMVQLWVNLPAKHKMTAPRYQSIKSAEIPIVDLSEGAGALRVIAGAFGGATGPAQTFTPINLWDIRLQARGHFVLPAEPGHTLALVVLRGEVSIENTDQIAADETLVFDRQGGELSVFADSEASLLVLSGDPFDEPVVAHGPFVMNTQDEIRQAMADYTAGRFGR